MAVTLKIPAHPERGTKVDYTGAALLAAGLSALLLGTVRGSQDAPWLMGAGFVLLSLLDAGSSLTLATVAMVVSGLGLGLLIQNLSLVVQTPCRAATWARPGAAQFSRTIGGTIGVSVLGAILAAGLPAGALGAAPGLAAREALAAAIHPVFVIGVPMMAVTFALVALIPELPLRGAVRDDVAAPAPGREGAVAA